jgi:hypothetical protein
MKIIGIPCVYASLLLCSLSSTLFGQVAVYDYSERAVWFGQGETSKQTIAGKWIFDLATARVVKITLYPANKLYSVSDYSEDVLRAVGPKSQTLSVIGYASYLDAEFETFLDYESLVGIDKPFPLGGPYSTIPIPHLMTGPIFNTYTDAELGNDIRRGSIQLKLNTKQTQLYNSLQRAPTQISAELINFYRAQGYKSFTE